ncbi:MAG: hypothetical protein DRQ39_10985, partial [Gammaproteobacteria bacterium]
QSYDSFPAETHELGLDRGIMIAQEQADAVAGVGVGGDPGSPSTGLYVPLVGTEPSFPITGNLEWNAPAASGRYRLRHNYSYSQTNLFGIMTDDPDSIVLVQARDTAANGSLVRNWFFHETGSLYFPSAEAARNWTIGFGDWFGAEVLTFAPTASGGGIGPDKGYVFLTNDGIDDHAYYMNSVGELLLPKQPDGASPELMAATVKYVNDAIGGDATEQQLSNVGGGVELGKANSGIFLPLRTLGNTDDNITITLNGDLVEIDLADQVDVIGIGAETIFADNIGSELRMWCNGEPTLDEDVVTLHYFEQNTALLYVNLTGPNTISGIKTFNESIAAVGGIGWTAGAVGSTLNLDSTFHCNGKPTTDYSVGSGDTSDTLSTKGYVDYVGQLLDAAKADTDHNHSGVYSPVSHNHSGVYLPIGGGTITGALHVNSTLSSSTFNQQGPIYSNFGVLTNVNPCDARLKNSIENLSYGLPEVMQLISRRFKYNEGGDSWTYGFIAQELQAVMPEYVVENGEYLGIRGDFIPVLVNAIQSQQDRLDKLEARLAFLEGILGE